MKSNPSSQNVVPSEDAAAGEALSRVRALRRDHILDAADRLVLREGYYAATMDRVAEEARVSKQTLYNYFADKESLFVALVQKWKCRGTLQRLRAALAAIDPASVEQRGELCAALGALFGESEGRDPAAMFRLMLEIAAELPRLSAELHAELLPHKGDLVREALTEAIAAGRVRPVDVEVASAALLVLISGYASIQPLVLGERNADLPPARMAAGLADLLLYGLLPRN
jgi:AcrR family transcriptional regulator